MNTTEIKEALGQDMPLWIRLVGSNRVWRYGGWDAYHAGHTALHQQDGLVRYFDVDEVVEILTSTSSANQQGNSSAGLGSVMDVDEHSYASGWRYSKGIPKVRK